MNAEEQGLLDSLLRRNRVLRKHAETQARLVKAQNERIISLLQQLDFACGVVERQRETLALFRAEQAEPSPSKVH